ncbi:hypothetical protein [Scandinavium sp.]|uniref:winged helix-turn-helix domain-containing protein n=1 Tax=Scandinavium sp. TaxID=2830653 RepID=UPI00289D9588|nr:hypothetical protein [Scandinavium sp.]
MTVIYLINNVLSFSPADKLLKNIEENISASLHTPASNCLQALIERQGEVIRQEELYKIGWGEIKGPSTSPSAYYQCFVNLRKQLKIIGYEAELVITVPKEGMKLDPNARITVVEVNPEQDVSSLSVCPRSRVITSWLKTNKLLTTFIIGFCVVMVKLVFISFHRHEYVSQRFRPVNALPACLLLKKDADISTEEAVGIIHSYKIMCSSDKPVYVSVTPGKLTGIQCDKELKRCTSFTEISHYE